MSKHKILSYTALFAALFTSCLKSTPQCDGQLHPVVKTNSPLIAGDTLKLSVSGIGDVYYCYWKTPSGSRYAGPDVSLPYAFAKDAGVYTVEVVTAGGCIYTAKTDSVIVQDLPANTCTIGPRSMRIGMTGYSVPDLRATVDYGKFRLDGKFENYMDVAFYFGSPESELKEGGYIVGDFRAENVPAGRVSVYLAVRQTRWFIPAGTIIYMSKSGPRWTVSFCDVPAVNAAGDKEKISLSMTMY